MPVIGIVVGFLLLMAVAAGGALLWRRMRKGLPGVEQEEGKNSERDRPGVGVGGPTDLDRKEQGHGRWWDGREETEALRGDRNLWNRTETGKDRQTHVGEGQSGTPGDFRDSHDLPHPLPLPSAPWMSLRGDDDVGALLPTPGVPKDADS